MRNRRGIDGGFTYLGLLFVVALMGVGLAAVGELWYERSQRERAAQEAWINKQLARARQKYHDASPGSVKEWPASVEDLLEDRRHLGMRRHLREDYRLGLRQLASDPPP